MLLTVPIIAPLNSPAQQRWGALATMSLEGIRVTPNVFTTLKEVDMFAKAVKKIASAQ